MKGKIKMTASCRRPAPTKMAGSVNAASIVPEEILDALIDVIFAPPPIKFVAVVVPETFTFCRKVAFVFVLILSVTAIPVRFAPDIAGSVDGNLASGIVPDDRLLALNAFIIEDVTNAAPFVS